MKIQPYINQNNSVSFQYNKKYHKKVKKHLSNNIDKYPIADYLLRQEETLLELEDRVNEYEKTKKGLKSEKYLDLSSLLTSLKSATVYYMELHFPELYYANNTMEECIQERKNKKDIITYNDWRYYLCKEIKPFVLKDYSDELPGLYKDLNSSKKAADDNGDDEISKSTQEQNQTLDEVRKQAVDDHINKKGEQLANIFLPSKSSPAGFCDVVGMDKIKTRFQDEIIDYINNPELLEVDFKEYGIEIPRGYILYGPPGCGKTFIAQALAVESGLPMYCMKISQVGSKFINETSNNIQATFDYLENIAKKTNKPVLLFMDEIDSLGYARDGSHSSSIENTKSVSTLLNLINDARDKNIIIIAATNEFNSLDNALKNRFDGQIYIGLPDLEQRIAVVKNELLKKEKGADLAHDEAILRQLCSLLDNYSTRSICYIIKEASKLAKKRNRSQISEQDFIQAIDNLKLDKINEDRYRADINKTNNIGFKPRFLTNPVKEN